MREGQSPLMAPGSFWTWACTGPAQSRQSFRSPVISVLSQFGCVMSRTGFYGYSNGPQALFFQVLIWWVSTSVYVFVFSFRLISKYIFQRGISEVGGPLPLHRSSRSTQRLPVPSAAIHGPGSLTWIAFPYVCSVICKTQLLVFNNQLPEKNGNVIGPKWILIFFILLR